MGPGPFLKHCYGIRLKSFWSLVDFIRLDETFFLSLLWFIKIVLVNGTVGRVRSGFIKSGYRYEDPEHGLITVSVAGYYILASMT
jgi:hypothetical protein